MDTYNNVLEALDEDAKVDGGKMKRGEGGETEEKETVYSG